MQSFVMMKLLWVVYGSFGKATPSSKHAGYGHYEGKWVARQGIVISDWEALDPFHVPYRRHYRSDVLSVVGVRVDMISYVFGGFSIFGRVMGGTSVKD
ncbi:hypothetical protein Tco_0957141 [Tanacetum coccineum]